MISNIPSADQHKELLKGVKTLAAEMAKRVTTEWESHEDSGMDRLSLSMLRTMDRLIKNSTKYSELVHLIRSEYFSSINMDTLHDMILDELGNCESPTGTSDELMATVATATIIYLSAHSDGRWKEIEEIIKWYSKKLESGFAYEDFLSFELAQLYVNFGMASHKASNEGGTSVRLLAELLSRLNKACDSSDLGQHHDVQFRYGFMMLSSSVMLLPFALMRDENAYRDRAEWLRDRIEELPDNRRSYRERLTEGKIAYANTDSNIDDAVQKTEEAVHEAPAHDQRFINEARQFLNLLDLEEQSLKRNLDARSEVTKKMRALEDRQTEVNSSVTKGQETINQRTEDAFIKVERVRDEVKDATLRIVEVLGLFLAIGSVAITAVGGISTGSIGEAALIFGLGYATIVSLLFVLRWVLYDRLPWKRASESNDKHFKPQTHDSQAQKMDEDGLSYSSFGTLYEHLHDK